MGEDKKKSIFYIKPPSSSTSSSSPPCWQTCAIFFCVCVIFPPLELRPPPVFRESAWSRDQKNSFLLSYFLYFFSSFPGLKPFCWAHTHTHAACRAEQHPCVSPHRCSLDTLGKKFSVDSQHLKTIAAQFFHAHWILFSTSEIWMNVARSTDNSSNNNTNRWVNLFLFI